MGGNFFLPFLWVVFVLLKVEEKKKIELQEML